MIVSILFSLAMAPPEPVVWTKMADPDPHYVAPKQSAESQRPAAEAGPRRGSEPDNLESAVVNLMQAGKEVQDAAIRDYERQVRDLEAQAEQAIRAAEQAVDHSKQAVENADPHR